MLMVMLGLDLLFVRDRNGGHCDGHKVLAMMVVMLMLMILMMMMMMMMMVLVVMMVIFISGGKMRIYSFDIST